MQQGGVVNMSWVRGRILFAGVLLACYVRRTSGSGFLHTPMGRGTVGYPNPINPDHMNNYCPFISLLPDFIPQCGVCGDRLSGPRKHEVGGEYATGKMTGSYKAGAIIPVKVILTASQQGWLEFRLCPTSNPKDEVTQQCLDQNLLKFADGKTRRTVDVKEKEIDMKLKLPDNVTCSHCVLQWKYQTGDGAYKQSACLGGNWSKCRPVFIYFNCADISITGTASMQSNIALKTDPVTMPASKPTPPVTKPAAMLVTLLVTKPATKLVTPPVTPPVTKLVTLHVTKPATKPLTQPVTMPATKPATQPPVKSTVAKPSGNCVAIGNWVNQPGMLSWCTDNCARGHCPADMCAC